MNSFSSNKSHYDIFIEAKKPKNTQNNESKCM